MTATPPRRARRPRRSLSLRGAIVTLAVGVLVPVILSTSVGIVALVIGSSTKELLIGVLVVSFTTAALGGAIVAVVLLSRRARLARLQSDLLANVSHELRTPLASIRMYAQTLLTGALRDDPEGTRSSLEVIVRESERLEATIDRVLTWRALARDRDEVALRPAPVGEAVRAAVERFERMVPPGEVALEVAVAADEAVAHDREALTRVVLNLLVNAHKYGGEDQRVRVEVERAGERVEIRVADNGPGIAAGEMERIFEPFYRGGRGGEGRVAGAGLGLAIVRHLVHLHAGEVRVVSRVGVGSTFTVSLPLAAPEEAG